MAGFSVSNRHWWRGFFDWRHGRGVLTAQGAARRQDARGGLLRRAGEGGEVAHLAARPGRSLAVEVELHVVEWPAAPPSRGSPALQRSPSRFAIAAGRSSAASSRAAGRRRRAAAARTGWSRRRRRSGGRELCGRGASSLTSSLPSRVTNISTQSTPTTSSRSSTARAMLAAPRASHVRRYGGRRDRDVEDVVGVAVLERAVSRRSSPSTAAAPRRPRPRDAKSTKASSTAGSTRRVGVPGRRRLRRRRRSAPGPCRRSRSRRS